MKSLPRIRTDRQIYSELLQNGCTIDMGEFIILVGCAHAFIETVGSEKDGGYISFINYDKFIDWLNNPRNKDRELADWLNNPTSEADDE